MLYLADFAGVLARYLHVAGARLSGKLLTEQTLVPRIRAISQPRGT
jgi:hypothetical protein